MAKVALKQLPKSVEATGITPTCLQLNYEGHRIHTDEPPSRGGTDVGPPPFDSFVAMLTGCSHVILGLIADELGVAWDDPEIGADWAVTDPILSDRDRANPLRAEIEPRLRPHNTLRT